MSKVSRIALTAGEPAGIGPDLCIQLAQQKQRCDLIVIADPEVLCQRAANLGLAVQFELADLTQAASETPIGIIRYLPETVSVPVIAGQLDSSNADYVLKTLRTAANGCLSGQFDALVTGPVHKAVINQAGIRFSGHTEFFAELAGVNQVVMMLATDSLRVALVTTHLPLKEVSSAITQTLLSQVIEILHSSLQQQFGVESPRIAVCGLNPHAGEGGHLGKEEIDIIEPVIDKFKQGGMMVSGPWPADTIFVEENLVEFDVVLAMYHDQGLPVLKHSGFSKAVNVTLGLPFIRTSVDHGTALHLAATGQSKVTSLQAAIAMAIDSVNSRK